MQSVWTEERTWVTGEVATTTRLNASITGNIEYLSYAPSVRAWSTVAQTGIPEAPGTFLTWDHNEDFTNAYVHKFGEVAYQSFGANPEWRFNREGVWHLSCAADILSDGEYGNLWLGFGAHIDSLDLDIVVAAAQMSTTDEATDVQTRLCVTTDWYFYKNDRIWVVAIKDLDTEMPTTKEVSSELFSTPIFTATWVRGPAL